MKPVPKRKARKPRKPVPPIPQLNRERAGRALAMTTMCTDAEAARRSSVEVGSIGRWRKLLPSDPELRAIYDHHVATMDTRWRYEIQEVAMQAASDLRQLHSLTTDLVSELLEHPEKFGEEDDSGEMRYPSAVDRIKLASQVQGDVRATLDKAAEILTHYAALVAEPEDHGAPEKAREDSGSAPSAQGRPRSSPAVN